MEKIYLHKIFHDKGNWKLVIWKMEKETEDNVKKDPREKGNKNWG
jgi:hypothetical protein